MKKYMVIWGAMCFMVVCVSLYLMMETVSSNSGKAPGDGQNLDEIEEKILAIQKDISKNHETIVEIREAVKQVSTGDIKTINKLKNILNPDGGHHKVFVMEKKQEANKNDNKISEETIKEWNPAQKDVKIPSNMCSLADAPISKSDVQVLKVFDLIPFDNPDGGSWKQGWQVTYDPDQWANKKLHIYVVPHTHNDPGWLKTFVDYYRTQTRNIFENMLNKLEQYPKMKIIFAEMSYLNLFWDEINDNKKARMKKLIDNGQLEIVTGGWVMTDEANAHYFAMIDQMIEGNQWLHGTLGVKPQSGWAIDPFGHSPTMAYILKKAGLKNMLVQRIHYSIKKYLAKNKQLEFMWRQQWDQDGTTDMFCHMMPFYSYDVPHTCGPDPKVCCQFDFRRLPGKRWNCPWRAPPVKITNENVEQRAKMLLDQYKKKAQLYRSDVVLAPLGDDFRYDLPDEWDFQYENYEMIMNYINAHPELGAHIQFGTLSEYFNKLYELNEVEKGHQPPGYPVLSGDFFTYSDRDQHYWSGYFTSRPFYKHLDRVMEYHLRAAEIIFTLATSYGRKLGLQNFPLQSMMSKLIGARRNLGLYQHHDGITGTAKDVVVIDYGKRMLRGIMDTKRIIVEAATFLSMKDKQSYKYAEPQSHYFNLFRSFWETEAQRYFFDLDEQRKEHDSLPERTVIKVSEDKSIVLFYNSLGHERLEIAKIYVDHRYIEVTGPDGLVVSTQTDPYWTDRNSISNMIYKVSFVVSVPGLGISRYLIRQVTPDHNPKNTLSEVVFYNLDAPSDAGSFSMKRQESEDFSLENSNLKADFSGKTGLLKSVTNKNDETTHNAEVQFVTYGTINSKERSGAYLFLPDGPAKKQEESDPVIRIIKGPIVSEVSVFRRHVQHVVRVHTSPGTDGVSVDIFNLVDIRQELNFELAMRIKTDIENTDKEFYTDLNGFQMQKHKTLSKLPIQANYYPMPAMAYIEDEKTRFSILTGQSLGVASLEKGVIEVMLDRRLNQDDGRGLRQGVRDNKLTPNRFFFLFEERTNLRPKGKMNGYPSLQSHMTYLHLVHPLFMIPQSEKTGSLSISPLFSPLSKSMPCEIHLLNLRTLQNKDDDKELKYIPRDESALLLHHLGLDCGFPNRGLFCEASGGKVVLKDLFKDVKIETVTETSLSLLHDSEEIEPSASLKLNPMEIYTYRVKVQ